MVSGNKRESKRSSYHPTTHHHLTHHHNYRIIVQHNYHDHAADVPPMDSSSSYETFTRSGVNTAFPLKLFDMLMNAEAAGISHIVSFAPHGRAIQIHNAEAFKEFLLCYFILSK